MLPLKALLCYFLRPYHDFFTKMHVYMYLLLSFCVFIGRSFSNNSFLFINRIGVSGFQIRPFELDFLILMALSHVLIARFDM